MWTRACERGLMCGINYDAEHCTEATTNQRAETINKQEPQTTYRITLQERTGREAKLKSCVQFAPDAF